MRPPQIVALLMLVSAALVLACTDGGDDAADTETPAPSETAAVEATNSPGAVSPTTVASSPAESVLSGDEQMYLDALGAVIGDVDEVFGGAERALRQTWPFRARLIEVLVERDGTATLDRALGQLQALDPPAKFEPDHRGLSQSLLEMIEVSKQQDAALADDDLVTFVVEQSAFNRTFSALWLGSSAEFCGGFAAVLQGFICRAEEMPGGDYGQAVRSIFDEYFVEFGSRASVFPPGLAEEERFEALGFMQPGIIASIDSTEAQLVLLDPPPEFVGDHDRLLQYLREIREVATSIDANVDAGDTAGIFADFDRSGAVSCGATAELSDDMLILTAPILFRC